MYIVLNYKYVFVSDGYMSKSDQLLVGLVQEKVIQRSACVRMFVETR